MTFAPGDPREGFVVKAHVSGGDDFAVCRDPDQVAADDVRRATDEDSGDSAGDELVVTLAHLLGDDSGAAKRLTKGRWFITRWRQPVMTSSGGILGLAVSDKLKGGGSMSDCVGPE